MQHIKRGFTSVLALLATILLVSCGGEPDAKLETGTSFSMVVGTHQATLPPGTGVVNPINLNWVGCPPRPVTLDVVGLPTGITAGFSANPALTSTDLRFDVGPAVPNGTYTFQIRGASDSLIQTQPFQLVVDNAAPAFTASFSPATVVLDPVMPASTQATITRTGGLATPITVTATLPPGMTYTVASPRIVGAAVAETYTITFQGSGAVAPGAYLAQVHLSAGSLVVSQTIPMTVVSLPTASLSAAATTVTTGTATTLTPTFTGGTAALTGLTGPFTSGTPVSTGPLAASTTFTLTVTNAAGSTATASVAITAVAPPTVPVITAPANVTTGGTGYTASIPAQAGSTYAWSISGGTLTAGAGTTGVTFTAGAVGTLTLSCTVTNAAGLVSAPGTATVAVVAVPATPVVTAPANATTGVAGYTASIPAQAGSTYAWSISGGTLTAGAGTTGVTFTAGAVGTLTLTCTVTNAAGDASASGSATVAVVAVPTAPVITAPANATTGAAGYTASIPAQAGSTYAWSISGGTLTAGAGTTGVTFTAGAVGTLTLSCTVTNAAGTASAPGTSTVTVVAAPTTPVVTAPANATTGGTGYTASIPAQAGSTYSWSISGGTITAGAGTTGITFTAGAVGTLTLSCTVTNAAGTASAPGTAAVTVVAAPTAPVITGPANVTTAVTGYTASIPAQAGSTYSWSISGGTITAGAGTTGITFTAGAVGTLTLSCSVTNAAGDVGAPGTLAVNVVAVPTISGFSVASASPGNPFPGPNPTTNLLYGEPLAFTAFFSGGTGTLSNGYGAIAGDGTPLTGSGILSVPSGTTSVVLTVTNAAGTSVSTTASITVQTVTISLDYPTPPTFTISAGGSTNVNSTVTGAYSPTTTWAVDLGGGTFGPCDGYCYTAPAVPGTFTIKAISPDPSVFATVTANVVALPVITAFTRSNSAGTDTIFASFTGSASGTASLYDTTVPAAPVLIGTMTSGQTLSFNAPLPEAYKLVVVNAANTQVEAYVSGIAVTINEGSTWTMAGGSATTFPTQTFTATASGSTAGVYWSITGGTDPGSIDYLSGVYTPSALPGTYTITATSQSDPTKSATLAVTTYPIFIWPGNQVVGLNHQLTLRASVLGVANPAVTWSLDPSTPTGSTYGSVDANGVYTSPSTPPPSDPIVWATLASNTAVKVSVSIAVSTSINSGGRLRGGFTTPGFAAGVTDARSGHTATTLANGEVLVAGGENPLAPSVTPATAYYYRTADNTVYDLPFSPMSAVRKWASATLLPDGSVLIAGGLDENGAPLATAERFYPYSAWGGYFQPTTGAMNTARATHTATLLPNGKVLLVGGQVTPGPGPTITATAELFDPTTNTFTSLASGLRAPRVYHRAVRLHNGKVLVVGGSVDGQLTEVAISKQADLFDPATGTFSPVSDLIHPVMDPVLDVTPSGDVILAGGIFVPSAGMVINSAEIVSYAPATDTWSAGFPSLSSQRHAPLGMMLPDRTFCIWGGSGVGSMDFLNVGSGGFDAGDTNITLPLTAPNWAGQTGRLVLMLNGRLLAVGWDGSSTAFRATVYP